MKVAKNRLFSGSLIIQDKFRRIVRGPPTPSSSVAGQKRAVVGAGGGGTGEDVELWKVEQRPEEVKGNYSVCAALHHRVREGRRKREGWRDGGREAV